MFANVYEKETMLESLAISQLLWTIPIAYILYVLTAEFGETQ